MQAHIDVARPPMTGGDMCLRTIQVHLGAPPQPESPARRYSSILPDMLYMYGRNRYHIFLVLSGEDAGRFFPMLRVVKPRDKDHLPIRTPRHDIKRYFPQEEACI